MKNLLDLLPAKGKVTGISLIIFALFVFLFPKVLSYFLGGLALIVGIFILVRSLNSKEKDQKKERKETFTYYEEWNP